MGLYKAATGEGWSDYAETLGKISTLYYSIFLFFTAFFILAVMNIVTGVFVDRAMKVSHEDFDGMVLERLNYERHMVKDLVRTYMAIMDTPIEEVANAPVMSQKDFSEHMTQSPTLKARFAVMGLEIWQPSAFYKLLAELSPRNQVDLPSFVSGCMQLRKEGRAIVLHGLEAGMARLLADRQMTKSWLENNLKEPETCQDHAKTIDLDLLNLGTGSDN